MEEGFYEFGNPLEELEDEIIDDEETEIIEEDTEYDDILEEFLPEETEKEIEEGLRQGEIIGGLIKKFTDYIRKAEPNYNLEGLVRKEKKYLRRLLGPKSLEGRARTWRNHCLTLSEIKECLIYFSKYFNDRQEALNNFLNEDMEIIREGIGDLREALKDYLKFMRKNSYDWFGDQGKFKKLFKVRRINHSPLSYTRTLERYFRECRTNTERIRLQVEREEAKAFNLPHILYPNTIKFFDKFHYSLRKNKGAKYFLNSYFKRQK